MCDFGNCKIKNSLIGHCKHCKLIFCNKHRQVELHNCKFLIEIKINKQNLLKNTLLNGKIHSNKIIKI